eukprot:7921800-Pyramimonas_sp.AAC.1
MTEAARLTRNEIQALPMGDESEDATDGRRLTARAIARAIWRQDVQLALRLVRSTEMGAKHIAISSSD